MFGSSGLLVLAVVEQQPEMQLPAAVLVAEQRLAAVPVVEPQPVAELVVAPAVEPQPEPRWKQQRWMPQHWKLQRLMQRR